MSGSGNFYDQVYDSTAYSIEQAILAEDVNFSTIKNVEGKFFIKILTPMVSSDKVSIQNKAGIKSINYITLTIPAYMLFQFIEVQFKTIRDYDGNSHKIIERTKDSYKIPKGTIFMVEFLGGQCDADKAYIVGISPFKYVS